MSDSTAPRRDGSTRERAIISFGLLNNPGEDSRYHVPHFNQWVETDPREAREYHSLGFQVFNANGNRPLEEGDWVRPLRTVDTTNAFGDQFAEIDRLREAHAAAAEEAEKEADEELKQASAKKGTSDKSVVKKPEGRKDGPDNGAGGAGSIST